MAKFKFTISLLICKQDAFDQKQKEGYQTHVDFNSIWLQLTLIDSPLQQLDISS